jgi:hypothetical protein
MIQFRDKDHCYVNVETGEQLVSVTTLLKKYEPPKDWHKIATAYAKKNGFTAEHWLKVWEDNKNDAAEKGTEYHASRENQFLEMEKAGKKVVTNQLVDGIKYSTPLKNLKPGIYSEIILYSEYYGVVGQSDVCEIFPKKMFDINDFKTSKKIEFESFYNWKTGHEFMLPPLNHLHNCNGVKFELQTSTYAYFLELEGFKCNKLSVEMVKENNKIYPLRYLKDEVIAMLKDYKNPPKKEAFNIYNFI